ncbi:carboxymuconolactone decarboxylase family protein [Dactylosporangium sp. NPDC000555]|uniref:carboxymuconolactone decarboxylase family protein n=1 Tax=Dactylosporangium sp. NPDC000555 TaxID=3154260 RepID=UPI003320EEFA
MTAATGLVARVYTQVADEMRLVVPPAQLHSPSPPLLAAYWMLLREPLLADGALDRGLKEAVATAVAVANICPYCVDMHSVSLYDLATEHEAEAIAADRAGDVADPRHRALTMWARDAHEAGNGPPPPDGLSAAARAELVGLVVGQHYVTRLVNVFLANFLLPPGLGPRARRRLKRGVSRVLRPTLRDPRPVGRSLSLLPAAPLPPDAEWAAGSPVVAAAIGAAAAAFDAAGDRSLSPQVRALVSGRLNSWRGEEFGPDLTECEDLVAGLPPADRAAARLALLTALASHQVGDDVIGEFRRHHPDDATLIEAAGWAAFAAASRVGARIPVLPGGRAGTAQRT